MHRLFEGPSKPRPDSNTPESQPRSSTAFIQGALVRVLFGKPTSPTPLPNELYRHILSFLPPGRELYPLLLVNSIFHAIAEPLLYSHILLKGGMVYAKGKHIDRRVKLFNLLTARPDLANLVRSLELSTFFEPLGSRPDSDLETTHRLALDSALRTMPNLKRLKIEPFFGGRREPLERYEEVELLIRTLHRCPFRLQILAISHKAYFIPQFPDETMEHVTSQVEELVIHADLDRSTVSWPQSFPRLEILEVTSASEYLPMLPQSTRKVRALYVRLNNVFWWPRVPYTPFPCPAIRCLRLRSALSVGWNNLAACFPSLRFLRIDLVDTRVRLCFSSSLKHSG